MAFNFNYKIDPSKEGRQKFLQALVKVVETAANVAALEFRAALVEVSPVGATALLQSSWQANPARVENDLISASVSSSQLSALIIDQGAKPHFPSIGDEANEPALSDWIRRKMGIEDPAAIRQIALSISRKFKAQGIRPKALFSNEFVKMQNRFNDILAQGLKALEKRFP